MTRAGPCYVYPEPYCICTTCAFGCYTEFCQEACFLAYLGQLLRLVLYRVSSKLSIIYSRQIRLIVLGVFCFLCLLLSSRFSVRRSFVLSRSLLGCPGSEVLLEVRSDPGFISSGACLISVKLVFLVFRKILTTPTFQRSNVSTCSSNGPFRYTEHCSKVSVLVHHVHCRVRVRLVLPEVFWTSSFHHVQVPRVRGQ